MSAHIDGSYIVWNASDSTTPKESALTPYGKDLNPVNQKQDFLCKWRSAYKKI